MPQIKFAGVVTSGEGCGKKFVALPWVQRQIKAQLGFLPYLGTLNLILAEESAQQKKLFDSAKAMVIAPAEGFCAGLLFKATILSVECAVVLPQIKDYPENKLEIIAPVNLREKLKIKDGDVVNVSVWV